MKPLILILSLAVVVPLTLDLLAQGFEVPELTLTEIAAEADAVLDRYERLVRMPTIAPVEVEDIATSLLELEFEFVDLQSRFADRIHGATWLRRGLFMFDGKQFLSADGSAADIQRVVGGDVFGTGNSDSVELVGNGQDGCGHDISGVFGIRRRVG
jgi:hypothetical protein